MKIVSLIARLLLGLEFLVFGLNGFLGFLHMPMPTGLAGQYMMVLFGSHYSVLVFGFQVIAGALLLANLFVPLAATILAGILVNILAYHVTMAPEGLPLALITTVLWLLVFVSVRKAFAGLFAAKVE